MHCSVNVFPKYRNIFLGLRAICNIYRPFAFLLTVILDSSLVQVGNNGIIYSADIDPLRVGVNKEQRDRGLKFMI